MTGPKLRVAVAGAGWVAEARHVPTILARTDADLIGIYDRSIDRARALARSAGRPGGPQVKATADFQELLSEAPDIVHVTSSPWSHSDLTIAALGAGAHVFCEKPMAMDLTQAQLMVSTAGAANRLLCVSHNFLYSDAMGRARRMLAGAPVDYVLGLQLSADSRRLPDWYRELPAGLLFDEIPHMLYTLGDLLGGNLELDHVRGRFDESGHPRTVELLVTGASGPGQVTMNFASPVSEWHVIISSRSKLVDLDLFRDIAVGIAPDGEHGSIDIARSSLAAVSGHVAGFARAGARWVRHHQFWGHDVLIGAFYDAVRGRGASPVDAADALGVVALTDALLGDLGVRPRPS